MNKAYRLTWSETKQMLVVRAENSRCRGKKSGNVKRAALVVGALALLGCPCGGVAWGANAMCVSSNTVDTNNNTISTIGGVGTTYTYVINGTTVTESYSGANSVACGHSAAVLPNQVKDTTRGNNGLDDNGKTIWKASNDNASNSVAIGSWAHTHAQGAVSIGSGSDATGRNSVAIGSGETYTDIHQGTSASGQGAIAIGSGAHAGKLGGGTGQDDNALNAIAIGTAVETYHKNATGVGAYAQAVGDGNTALGTSARATGTKEATATGEGAVASGESSTATGAGAQATGKQSTATGVNSIASGERATAYGYGAEATGSQSVALGEDTHATADRAVAVGTSAHAEAQLSTAVGDYAWATGQYSTATGHYSIAGAKDATGTGHQSTAAGEAATALGSYSKTLGDHATAVGTGARVGKAADVTDFESKHTTWRNTETALTTAETTLTTAQTVLTAEEAELTRLQNLYGTSPTPEQQAEIDAQQTKVNDAQTARDDAKTARDDAKTKFDDAKTKFDDAQTTYGNNYANAIAIGHNESAESKNEIHIGYNNNGGHAESSGVLGIGNKVSGKESYVVGNSNTVSGERSIATGYANEVTGGGSSATGRGNTVKGTYSGATGYRNTVEANQASATGNWNEIDAGSIQANVVGHTNKIKSSRDAGAFGNKNTLTASPGTTATGSGNELNNTTDSSVTGNSNTVDEKSTMATSTVLGIGNKIEASTVTNSNIIGINNYIDPSTITDSNINGIGNKLTDATLTDTTIHGNKNAVTGVALTSSTVTGNENTFDTAVENVHVVGNKNTVQANKSGVLGNESTVTAAAEGSYVIGNKAEATVKNAVALGSESKADRTFSGDVGILQDKDGNDSPYGYDVFDDAAYTLAGKDAPKRETEAITWGGKEGYGAISVGARDDSGNSTITRRITNMAAGAADTDAVNVAQLKQMKKYADSEIYDLVYGTGESGSKYGLQVGDTQTLMKAGGKLASQNLAHSSFHVISGEGTEAADIETQADSALQQAVSDAGAVDGQTVVAGSAVLEWLNGEADAGKYTTRNMTSRILQSTFDVEVDNPNYDPELAEGPGNMATILMPQTVNRVVMFGAEMPEYEYTASDGNKRRLRVNAPDSNGNATGTIDGLANTAPITNPAQRQAMSGSSRAATEGQLADSYFTITANGGNPSELHFGDTLNFGNSDGNVIIRKRGNDLTFNLNPDLNLRSVTLGGCTRVSGYGLQVCNGPSVTQDGIDAAGLPITNVPDGVGPYDAVNKGQLDALDHRLTNRINDVEDLASAGIASAMAAANIPQTTIPGTSLLGAGLGYYNDKAALAVGLSAMSDNGRWILKSSVGINSEELALGAGIGYLW